MKPRCPFLGLSRSNLCFPQRLIINYTDIHFSVLENPILESTPFGLNTNNWQIKDRVHMMSAFFTKIHTYGQGNLLPHYFSSWWSSKAFFKRPLRATPSQPMSGSAFGVSSCSVQFSRNQIALSVAGQSYVRWNSCPVGMAWRRVWFWVLTK